VDEPLLTPEQVAAIFAVRPQTIRDAVWRGKLPCVRLWTGRRKSLIRFRRADIERFISDRAHPGHASSGQKS
jgi:excisionase family DNA binding protein